MRRCFGAVLVLATVFFVSLRVQPARAAWHCNEPAECGGTDGSWWQAIPQSAKAAVVQGMISAYQSAYTLGRFNTYSAYLDAYGSASPGPAFNAFAQRLRSSADAAPAFGKTSAAYVSAIDRFYRTYPSKKALKVEALLRCLRDNPEYSCDVVGRADLLPWPTGP